MNLKKIKSERPYIVSCLISSGIFLACGTILLIVSAMILLSFDDPMALAAPFSLASLYLAAFLGGISAAVLTKDGIAAGAIGGIISACVVFVMSLLPSVPSGFDETTSLLCTLLVIPAYVLGSVIGRKREKKPSMIKRKQLIK